MDDWNKSFAINGIGPIVYKNVGIQQNLYAGNYEDIWKSLNSSFCAIIDFSLNFLFSFLSFAWLSHVQFKSFEFKNTEKSEPDSC